MSAKWRKKVNPDAVLRVLDDIKNVASDGRVSFFSFTYHDAMATLQNMVEFPLGMDILDRERIVRIAVSNVAAAQTLAQTKVLAEINNLVTNLLESNPISRRHIEPLAA